EGLGEQALVLPARPPWLTEVVQLAFSPDGALLASAISPPAYSRARGALVQWDLRTGLPRWQRTRPHGRSRVNSVAISPDGKWLASGGADRTVRIWDARTGKLRHTLPHSGSVVAVCFHPQGKWLLSGGTAQEGDRIVGGEIKGWDAS